MTAIDTAPRAHTASGANLAMLTGTWTNTNPVTRGISAMRARVVDDLLRITLVGTSPDGPVDWPEVAASVYHERNDEGLEQPFCARVEAPGMRVDLQGFLRQGVLVILAFTRFDDAGARANYFTKEFFHRIAP